MWEVPTLFCDGRFELKKELEQGVFLADEKESKVVVKVTPTDFTAEGQPIHQLRAGREIVVYQAILDQEKNRLSELYLL